MKSTYTEGQNLNIAVSTVIAKGLFGDLTGNLWESSHRILSSAELYATYVSAQPASTSKDVAAEISKAARLEASEKLAEMFGDVVVSCGEWLIEWSNSLLADSDLAGYRMTAIRDHFRAATDQRRLVTILTEGHSVLHSDPEGVEDVSKAFLLIWSDAEELYNAAMAVKNRPAGDDAQSLELANKKHVTAYRQVWSHISKLSSSLNKISWIDDAALSTELSEKAWSILLLNNYGAVPDTAVTWGAIIKFASPDSKFKWGDEIFGIAEGEGGEFSAVTNLSDIKAFVLRHGKPLVFTGLRYQVRRAGEMLVIESDQKRPPQEKLGRTLNVILMY